MKTYLILSGVGTLLRVCAVALVWVSLLRNKPDDDAIVYHNTGKGTIIRIEVDAGKVKGYIDKMRDKFSKGAH